MSDNNSFLSNYGNKRPEESLAPVPEKKLTFEEKSGFKMSKHDQTRPPEGSGGNKRPPAILIAGGAALIVIIIVLIIILSGGGVEVIDLTGRTLTDAKLWASQNGVMMSQLEAYSDTVEEGSVIGQDVPAGEKLPKGKFLTVTVSLGHDMGVMVPLPDFMSMTSDEVKAWADGNYMSKVRISAEFNESVPAGKVVSFNVNDSTVVNEVRRDASIVVVVSKGPEEETATIKVPDFKTKSLAECFTFAKENGITLTVNEEYDDYAPAGTIMSQSVKADQMVAKGTEITLVVSLGKRIVVPDFSDYYKEAATAKASQLGITATLTEQYSGSSAGAFISQSIKVDTVYTAGEILELKYSLGNRVVVSSYVGQTLDAIQAWALGLGEKGAKITIKSTETISSSPKGTIIYQDQASKEISYKTTINVTVSKGSVVYVPDFVGEYRNYNSAILREDAITMCEKAGLIPVFVQEANNTYLYNEIWYQDIAAGTEVTQGTKITLKYVQSAITTVPGDLIDKTEAEIDAGFIQTQGYDARLRFVIVHGDTYDTTGTIPNKVVNLSVAAGTTVAMGTTVTLTLGGGTPAP